MRMKRAGWLKEMPSRSTTLTPIARRIQQDVHHVIIQQVHLIHVEDAPVGGGQYPGFKMALPFLDGPFNIQRAHHSGPPSR